LIRFFGRTPPDSDQVKISSAQRTTIKWIDDEWRTFKIFTNAHKF
jgi:hypothetical protein